MAITIPGDLNAFQLNSSQLNQYGSPLNPPTGLIDDDMYKRVLTWFFYKGDGFVVSVPWLKRRVARFLTGINGSAPNVSDTSAISIRLAATGDVIIVIPNNDIGIILKALVSTRTVNMPFQFNFSVTLL